MSSLTPEQSANATPDASLQPSSINSAQRYLYDLHLLYKFIFKGNFYIFLSWHKAAQDEGRIGSSQSFLWHIQTFLQKNQLSTASKLRPFRQRIHPTTVSQYFPYIIYLLHISVTSHS